MIGAQTIDEAVAVRPEAAPAGSEVILFGSHAAGQAREDSDLDFPVVEPTVTGRRSEMVRLRETLRPPCVPADVLVVSREAFERWRRFPNNVIARAAREGRSFSHAG